MATSLQIVQSKYPNVRHIVNAKKSLPVTVSDRDAKTSLRKDHWGCAMVLACKRTLDVDGALISTRTGYLIKGDTAIRYAIGSAVNREITSFDRGAGFAPGEYMLQKPQPTLERGSGTRHPGDPAAGRLKHRAYAHVEGTRATLNTLLPAPKRKAKKRK